MRLSNDCTSQLGSSWTHPLYSCSKDSSLTWTAQCSHTALWRTLVNLVKLLIGATWDSGDVRMQKKTQFTVHWRVFSLFLIACCSSASRNCWTTLIAPDLPFVCLFVFGYWYLYGLRGNQYGVALMQDFFQTPAWWLILHRIKHNFYSTSHGDIASSIWFILMNLRRCLNPWGPHMFSYLWSVTRSFVIQNSLFSSVRTPYFLKRLKREVRKDPTKPMTARVKELGVHEKTVRVTTLLWNWWQRHRSTKGLSDARDSRTSWRQKSASFSTVMRNGVQYTATPISTTPEFLQPERKKRLKVPPSGQRNQKKLWFSCWWPPMDFIWTPSLYRKVKAWILNIIVMSFTFARSGF